MTFWVWLIFCCIRVCLIEAVGIWFTSNSFDVADGTNEVLVDSGKHGASGLKNWVGVARHLGVPLRCLEGIDELDWMLLRIPGDDQLGSESMSVKQISMKITITGQSNSSILCGALLNFISFPSRFFQIKCSWIVTMCTYKKWWDKINIGEITSSVTCRESDCTEEMDGFLGSN